MCRSMRGGEKARVRQMPGGDALLKPRANLIRMHLLIFVVFGLRAARMANLAIHTVLLFYFFSWGAFFVKKKAAE